RLATLRMCAEIENQAFLNTALGKLLRANKRVQHRKLGSNNREKARRQVTRLQYRMTRLPEDVLHKLTTQLATCCAIIRIEDLHRKGLAPASQAGSFLLGCRMSQTAGAAHEQGRAARRAGDQGGPLLSFQKDQQGTGPPGAPAGAATTNDGENETCLSVPT